MMWQGAGNPGSAYGLQQAMAAQAAAQQQQQQQEAPDVQVCTTHWSYQHRTLVGLMCSSDPAVRVDKSACAGTLSGGGMSVGPYITILHRRKS